MNEFLMILTSSAWLMDSRWLQAFVSAYPDIKAIDIKSFMLELNDADESKTERRIDNGTAVIPIHGPIFSKPNILTDFLGVGVIVTDVAKNIKEAKDNSEVDRIVLDFDTPGGQVVGVNETANIIGKVAEEIPVDAYVSGECCSAGYWLASRCDNIYMDATAGVGSIGVKAVIQKSENEHEITIVNSDSPQKNSDVSTEEGQEAIRTILDDIAAVFMESVAVGRDVSVETVKTDFGKGNVVIGKKAVEVGMADALSSFDEVMEITTKNSVKGGSSMDLETLKAKHPDLYNQVLVEGKDSVKVKEPDRDLKIKAEKSLQLEKDNKKLKEDLEAAKKETADLKAQNEGLEDRTKRLEKSDEIRTARELKQTADAIFTNAIASSSVKHLAGKIRKHVDHTAHVDEKGVFDVKGFGDACKAEIEDWEKQIGGDGVEIHGGGTSPFSVIPGGGTDDFSSEAKASMERMEKILGFKTE